MAADVHRGDQPGDGPPDAEALQRIGPDPWAWLLPVVREAMNAVDVPGDARLARLRAAPPGRLAGGRVRRDLCGLVAGGGAVWHELRSRLEAAADRPAELDWLVDADAPPPPGDESETVEAASPRAGDPTQEHRAKERARSLLRERDEARRKVEGAEARAAAAESRAEQLEDRLAELRARVGELERLLDEAEQATAEAVARERRRGASRTEELEQELGELRRAAQRRRERARREQAATRAAEERAGSRPRGGRGRQGADASAGRPTDLPEGIHPGSREAVEHLLQPGRYVLVDGYNVTRTLHPELSLEQQRRWLVDGLATLVARRDIRPTVIFDGASGSRPGAGRSARGVTVRFAVSTADDEIVFDVEAQEPDLPIVAVTDDVELRDRLSRHDVDLVGTTAFGWMLP